MIVNFRSDDEMILTMMGPTARIAILQADR